MRRTTRAATVLAAVLITITPLQAQELESSESLSTGIEPPASQPFRRIVVSIPDRKLALLENDRVMKIYHVAVGASATPTPTGQFTIIHRIPNPTYYKPGVIIRPGKANPLGTRWLGLSVKGYRIHGTNVPKSIGKAQSSGCIRMTNRDIEELFEQVKLGVTVELHGEVDESIAQIFKPTPETPAVETPALATKIETPVRSQS